MCEIKAYLLEDGGESLLMEDVAVLRQEGGEVELTDILGRQERIRGAISEVRVMDHKAFLLPLK